LGRQRQRQQQRRRARTAERKQAEPVQNSPQGGVGRGGLIGGVAVIVLAIAAFIFFTNRGSSAGPTATPSPAATSVALATTPIDGIGCETSEGSAYHIHQHLTLYDHGKNVPLPAYVGIPGGVSGNCLYWLHVHDMSPSNIVHIESPVKKFFTLGNFLDIWARTVSTTTPPSGRFLSNLKNAGRQGQVTLFVNGKRYTRPYRSLTLRSRLVITLEVGKPVVAPKPFTDWQNL